MTEDKQENVMVDEKLFFLYYTPSGRIEKAVLFHERTEGDVMTGKHNRYKRLTIHAEHTLIKFIAERFPGSSDIGYFSEIPSEKPGYQALSWAYNTHRRLSVRMSWQTGNLRMKQELVVDQETRNITFPITWSGLTLDFNEKGEAELEGTAARDFWAMLIGHNGEGIPKPKKS